MLKTVFLAEPLDVANLRYRTSLDEIPVFSLPDASRSAQNFLLSVSASNIDL